MYRYPIQEILSHNLLSLLKNLFVKSQAGVDFVRKRKILQCIDLYSIFNVLLWLSTQMRCTKRKPTVFVFQFGNFIFNISDIDVLRFLFRILNNSVHFSRIYFYCNDFFYEESCSKWSTILAGEDDLDSLRSGFTRWVLLDRWDRKSSIKAIKPTSATSCLGHSY